MGIFSQAYQVFVFSSEPGWVPRLHLQRSLIGTVLGVQEHEGNPRRKWRALAARMDPHRPLRQGSNHRWIQGLTTPLLLFVGCDGQGRSLAREGSGP